MRRFFTAEVRDAIVHAKEEALATGNTTIGVPHLILGLSRSHEDPCGRVLNLHGFDATFVREKVRAGAAISEVSAVVMSREGERLLKGSAFSAFLHSDRLIHPFNVLLTFLEDADEADWLVLHLADGGLDFNSATNELHSWDESLRAGYRHWLSTGLAYRLIRSKRLRRIVAWA